MKKLAASRTLLLSRPGVDPPRPEASCRMSRMEANSSAGCLRVSWYFPGAWK